jgi:glycosyltransferase involved in cell wall biosynthesis
MRLAINATEIGRQRGGNESYLTGLLQGLAALDVASDTTLFVTSECVPLLPTITSAVYPTINVGKYRKISFFLWQQTRHLARIRPDWYLSTFFLPPITPCHAAVLVHDMSFRTHPEFFPRFIAIYMRVLTSLAIQRAERVIALSEFTRREIARYHPAVTSKTVVVLPGIDPTFQPLPDIYDAQMLAQYGLTPGYILALGNIHPRKNLLRLLEAYDFLRLRFGNLPPLVWAGRPRWGSDALTERALEMGVTLLGFVNQAALPAIYRQAAMFVYPSLYEGFGLPPLEALACGTPVIVSDKASLPEAVGTAALLVDPTSVESIADAMARILKDADLRVYLRQTGIAHARQFTWQSTAKQLLGYLGEVE